MVKKTVLSSASVEWWTATTATNRWGRSLFVPHAVAGPRWVNVTMLWSPGGKSLFSRLSNPFGCDDEWDVRARCGCEMIPLHQAYFMCTIFLDEKYY